MALLVVVLVVGCSGEVFQFAGSCGLCLGGFASYVSCARVVLLILCVAVSGPRDRCNATLLK